MRKALLLVIFALCAVPAVAADSAQCDSTAFTLKKPVPATPKADKQQPKVQTAQAAPTKVEPKKKTTSRLLSDCKDKKPRG